MGVKVDQQRCAGLAARRDVTALGEVIARIGNRPTSPPKKLDVDLGRCSISDSIDFIKIS
jgi:hypothetical protein